MSGLLQQISNKKGRLLHVYPKQQEKKAKKFILKMASAAVKVKMFSLLI